MYSGLHQQYKLQSIVVYSSVLLTENGIRTRLQSMTLFEYSSIEYFSNNQQQLRPKILLILLAITQRPLASQLLVFTLYRVGRQPIVGATHHDVCLEFSVH